MTCLLTFMEKTTLSLTVPFFLCPFQNPPALATSSDFLHQAAQFPPCNFLCFISSDNTFSYLFLKKLKFTFLSIHQGLKSLFFCLPLVAPPPLIVCHQHSPKPHWGPSSLWWLLLALLLRTSLALIPLFNSGEARLLRLILSPISLMKILNGILLILKISSCC